MPNRLITIAEIYNTIPAVSVPDMCEAGESFGTALKAARKAAAEMAADAAKIDRHPKALFNTPPATGPAVRPIYVAATE